IVHVHILEQEVAAQFRAMAKRTGMRPTLRSALLQHNVNIFEMEPIARPGAQKLPRSADLAVSAAALQSPTLIGPIVTSLAVFDRELALGNISEAANRCRFEAQLTPGIVDVTPVHEQEFQVNLLEPLTACLSNAELSAAASFHATPDITTTVRVAS